MAVGGVPKVALVYDDDAYVEAGGGAPGLMGRQVAGRSFLDAYLSHGTFSELAALVRQRASAASLVQLWRDHPANGTEPRTMRVIERGEFHRTFFPVPPATILHSPQPPDPAFAWARQQGAPHAFALSGVTHTLCSTEAVELLRSLVTAPFEPYDALVCTSRAVADMVREVTGTYADHLRARLGGVPARGPSTPISARLETIPLGVDIDRFFPASPQDRATARRSFDVAGDEVLILYVGRLSHHAKAHPFPMFRGVSEAARVSGRKIHLLLAGWAAHPAVRDAFLDGARTFAANVRTSLVDGRDQETRRSVWHAADLFVSPSDSIQETFGLAVLEAMASGLPVVASDWDGYRDLVDDGQTGFLVPTAMVEGATAAATARLLVGELSYDHFLAETGQATAVHTPGMAAALARLTGDAALRRRMGDAGRRRAVEHFAWSRIIHLYEQLWRDQEAERSARARAGSGRSPWSGPAGPAAYPAPERSFAGYPTRRLGGADRVEPAPGTGDALDALLAMPLTHHAPGRRVTDPGLLRAALTLAPCSVDDLDRFWSRSGIVRGGGRATLAWMLKYDLLRASYNDRPEGELHR
ncbi:MAG: glycosyltransferase family 4 protein [Candidatus Limnocylindrales bacterium]